MLTVHNLIVSHYGRTSAAKLARKLGISPVAVVSRWYRARQRGDIPPFQPTSPVSQRHEWKLRHCGFKGDALREAMEGLR